MSGFPKGTEVEDHDKFLMLGCWSAPHRPTTWMVGTPIPPGRKHRHLVMVKKPWRSKYLRAICMGEGKRCRAGTCKHAESVAAFFRRCKPAPRTERSPHPETGAVGA